MESLLTKGERREQRQRNGSKMGVSGKTTIRLMQERVMKAAAKAREKTGG